MSDTPQDRMADEAHPISVSAEKAAGMIGVSPDFLMRSDCPRSRLGRRIVFLVDDLRAFVVQRRTHGKAA